MGRHWCLQQVVLPQGMGPGLGETRLAWIGFISTIPTHVADKRRRPQRPNPKKAPRLIDETWFLICDCWAQQPDARPDGFRRRISNISGDLASSSGTMSPLLDSSSQGSCSPHSSPKPLPRRGPSTSQQIPEDNFFLRH